MSVEFHWHGAAVVAALDAELCDRLDRGADVLIEAVRVEAPVDTGFLRASVHKINFDRANLRISVIADAPYAGNVRYRKPRYPEPNPFFLRAVEKAAPQVLDVLSGRK